MSSPNPPEEEAGRLPLFYKLVVLVTQAAPGVFYPFLRHRFGQRFWELPVLGLATLALFVAPFVRMFFPKATLWVTSRLPGNSFALPPDWKHDSDLGERILLSFVGLWACVLVLAVFHRIAAWRRSRNPAIPHVKSYHPGYSRLWPLVLLPGLRRLAFLRKYNAAELFFDPVLLALIGYGLAFFLPELGAFFVVGAFVLFWDEFRTWRRFHHMELDARDAVVSGFEHELRMQDALGRERTAAEAEAEKAARKEAPVPAPQPTPIGLPSAPLSEEHQAILDEAEAAQPRKAASREKKESA